MSRDEGILYDRYLMDRAILRNQMVTARGEGYIEGVEEGIEKGMEKGRSEEKIETAKKMKADGLPTELIA